MGKYTETVTYELAKLLNNRLYPIAGEYLYYAAEDEVAVTWDNYLGAKKFKEGELITDGDNIHGKHIVAPTYADVIDWLWEKYNIAIELLPAFTFALKGHVAYYVTAYKVNDEDGFTPVFENELEMYSFELGILDVVRNLLENGTIE